jgi:hypothetical protein
MINNSKIAYGFFSQEDFVEHTINRVLVDKLKLKQVNTGATDLVCHPEQVVNFGKFLGHYTPDQLYNMFKDNFSGVVGYGYVLLPGNNTYSTQPITIDGKEIGLTRLFEMEDDTPAFFVNKGGSIRGYNNLYLHSKVLEDIIPNDPKAFDFTLRIQQTDQIKLFGLTVKRFKMIKFHHTMQCFDRFVDASIFDENDDVDSVNRTIFSDNPEGVSVVLSRHELSNYKPPVFVVRDNTEVVDNYEEVIIKRKRPGRILNYHESIVAHVPVKNQTSIYTSVNKKTLNKVTLNFVNANSITPQLVKSNLGYINNVHPDIDLMNEAIPALMYAIKDTKCLETMLAAALKSKDVELIKALKDNQFSIAPTGLTEAFKSGALMDYIDYRIRGMFNLNVVYGPSENSKSDLDFH